MSTHLQLPSRKKKLFWHGLKPTLHRFHYLIVICKLLVQRTFFHRRSESPMVPSPDCMVDVSTPQISEHVVYPLYAQLFHGAGWQWSDYVIQATAQAHTARSSQSLYGILLRSRSVSRNKIFRCAYFFMHFRIKFLLFNDFPMYMLSSG